MKKVSLKELICTIKTCQRPIWTQISVPNMLCKKIVVKKYFSDQNIFVEAQMK